MQIGLLARQAGIAVDTVRYYEREGLLPRAQRRPSGYRDYDDHDVARLRFVRRAKALGFTLVEIRELLALSNRRDGDMAAMKAAASDKLADVEQRLAELTRVRDALRVLLDACPGHGPMATCPILAALSGGPDEPF